MANFILIPDYPNYEFCNRTLEVRSLKRRMKSGSGNYKRIEIILKPILHQGYYQFGLYNKNGHKVFKRSQICWMANTGSLPPVGIEIDHKDNIKTNDYFSNLQPLTCRQNTVKAIYYNGKKLPIGVYLYKLSGKYRSAITINGKVKYLGSFDTVDKASAAYQKELLGINEQYRERLPEIEHV